MNDEPGLTAYNELSDEAKLDADEMAAEEIRERRRWQMLPLRRASVSDEPLSLR